MNYQWTINLYDGYPLLQVMLPEEYIPPSLHTLCNLKPTILHLGDDCPCPTQIQQPPGDNGERFRAKVTIQLVEAIEKADGARVQNDLSSLASPKGEMKSSFSWTSLFKSPISST